MDSHMFVVSGLTKPKGELFLKLVHPWHRSVSTDVFQEPESLDFGLGGHKSLDRFLVALCLLYPRAGNEKIRIADGSLASIAGKGQTVLFNDFSLQNFLHVPKLSYNLLSISKITRELHCKATFLPKSVCFQDLSLGRTIGTARCHNRNFSTRLCGTCLAQSASQPFENRNPRSNSRYDVASLPVLGKMFL
ncbi:reverse transcriptase [Cucumis melo var. makuwa]|uniref:Reverse transcriptase n=1 Tax=Cucumis melo var. makuwa TaxID=1194695 RepID=A0A5D3BZS7_CUCMM|nr:reverse transcriptase [Cucumis melo var. makuwa]